MYGYKALYCSTCLPAERFVFAMLLGGGLEACRLLKSAVQGIDLDRTVASRNFFIRKTVFSNDIVHPTNAKKNDAVAARPTMLTVLSTNQ